MITVDGLDSSGCARLLKGSFFFPGVEKGIVSKSGIRTRRNVSFLRYRFILWYPISQIRGGCIQVAICHIDILLQRVVHVLTLVLGHSSV